MSIPQGSPFRCYAAATATATAIRSARAAPSPPATTAPATSDPTATANGVASEIPAAIYQPPFPEAAALAARTLLS